MDQGSGQMGELLGRRRRRRPPPSELFYRSIMDTRVRIGSILQANIDQIWSKYDQHFFFGTWQCSKIRKSRFF